MYVSAGTSPDILQFAAVNVISVEDCQDDWGSSISDQHICLRSDGDVDGSACFVSNEPDLG